MSTLYDKRGYEIMPGDTLKVFHFVGPRRKKFFMYKWVEAEVTLGKEKPVPALKISHLSLKEGGYHVLCDGSHLPDYEIVQGYSPDDRPFDERPRHKPSTL